MRLRRPPIASVLTALVSLLVTVLVVEVGFRIAGFDFEQKQRALENVPIYYRQPTLPVGKAFFRRPGPARWNGTVLTPVLRYHGIADHLLPDEPERSIAYDHQGFRNPADLDDWDVVIVGDSFTELGYLPHSDLFTTRLGARLGLGVKNLGVSFTGPFTHVFYLEAYGRAESTRHAVLAFFEGNDLDDLVRENRWLREARAGGGRHPQAARASPFVAQTSFLLALYAFATGVPGVAAAREPNFLFTGGGEEVPVTLEYAPPPASRVGRRGGLLSRALESWARTARASGMKPWLLYLPCKRRVLYGHLKELREESLAWRPTDLPELVRSLAEERGIEFVDPTEALRAETARGRLTYNALVDTHANRLGSLVIADVLARAFAAAEARPDPLRPN